MNAPIAWRNPRSAPLRRLRESGDLRSILLLGLLLCCALPAAAHPVRNVLVIYSDNRLLPANLEVDGALHESLVDTEARPIELYSEFLDRSLFTGAAHEANNAAFLAQKYSASSPDVVVTGGPYALQFMLRHRATLFPNTPIVFIGLSAAEVAELAPLPSDVIGVLCEFDYVGTIEQALRFHRKATRLILITGANEFDRLDEGRLAGVAPRLNGRVSVESWAGLQIDAIVKRVRSLGPTDVVFAPGFFTDGAGRQFTPRESTRIIAEASRAPVYGPFNTFIGTGIVGGVMPSYAAMGMDAATLVNRLLDGVPAGSIEVPARTPSALQIDWRQARRWGITEDDMPSGAIVHFKEPTFWEAYGHLALIALAVMLLQAGLIAGLLYERRLQRRMAEALEASDRRMVLAARTARLSNWVWDVATDSHANGSANGTSVPHAPLSREPAAVNFDQVLERTHPADREALQRAVRNAVENDEELNVEYRLMQRDQVRWFAARGRAEQNGGRLRGVAIDITQRKVAELEAEQDRTALRHMTRVSLLGQLSASIAHQLNQPLASILEQRGSSAENAAPRRRRSRGTAGDLRRHRLRGQPRGAGHPAARRAVQARRTRSAPAGRQRTGTRDDRSGADRPRHTADHGHHRFDPSAADDRRRARATAAGSAEPDPQRGRRDAEHARDHARTVGAYIASRRRGVGSTSSIVVPGSDRKNIERIFDMFWTTKPSGMGIGLAICRSIIDRTRRYA